MAQRETYINKNNSVIEIPAKAPDSEWTQRYIWNVPQTLEQLKINITPMDASEPNVYPTDIVLSGFNKVDIVINNQSFDKRKSVKSVSNEEDEQLVIQSIGDFAFRDCSTLETLGNSGVRILGNIGVCAFDGCTEWKTPTSDWKLSLSGYIAPGELAFAHCPNMDFYKCLNFVDLNGEPFVGKYKLNKSLFLGSGISQVLESEDIPYQCYRNCLKLQSVININGISNIGDYAFMNCDSIETVNFSNASEITIGENAFYGSEKLHTLNFKEGIKKINIKRRAFRGCQSIQTINFPSTLEELIIGEEAFVCYDEDSPNTFCSIKNVNLSKKLKHLVVEKLAFSKCKQLEQLSFPASLETLELGSKAFEECNSLPITFKLEASNKIIFKGPEVFLNVDHIENLELSTNELVIEASDIFKGALFKTIRLNEQSPHKHSIQQLGVENNQFLLSFGASFEILKIVCKELKHAINYNLENIEIYNSVNSTIDITNEIFSYFKNLKSLKLNETYNYIFRSVAFGGCTSLRRITYLKDETQLDSSAFYISPQLNIEFGSACFNGVLKTKNTDVASITFPKLKGVSDGSNLLQYCFGHKKINESIGLTFNLYDTKIPKNCFAGSNVEILKVPKDLTEIQDRAFYECNPLSAVIPLESGASFNSLSYVGEECFVNNSMGLIKADNTNKHWYVVIGNKRIYIDSIKDDPLTIVSPECDLVAKAAVRPEVTDITCAFIGNKKVHKEALTESKLFFIFKNNIFNLKNLTLKTKEGETIKLYSSSLHPALQNLRNATKLSILSPIETFGVCPFSYDIKIETLEFGTTEKLINVPDNFCNRKIAIQNLILNSNSVGTSSFAGLTGSLPYLNINTSGKLNFAHRAFYSDDLVIRTLEFNKEIEDWVKNVTAENKTSSPIPYVLKFKTPKYPDGVFRIAPAAELTPQSYTLSNNKFINEIDFTNLKLVDNNKGSLSGLALIHIYGPIETARGLIEETFNLKLDNSPKGKIYKDGEWGDVV